MTTLVFIENAAGSGQIIKVIEDFGDYSVSRELQPGESARLAISPFKSVVLEERPASRGDIPARVLGRLPMAALSMPRSVERSVS